MGDELYSSSEGGMRVYIGGNGCMMRHLLGYYNKENGKEKACCDGHVKQIRSKLVPAP